MSDKIKVFLCYAKEDLEKVEELYHKLEKEGLDPWLDTKKLLGGQEWETAINQAIRDSDFFVACLSNNAVTKKGFRHKEILNALDVWKEQPEGEIYLIPVRLENCSIPNRLKHLHYLDVYTDEGVNRLLATLKKANKPENTSYDDRFTARKNCIVYDVKTSLEWSVGSDVDTDWNEAKKWVESLAVAGDGWRMPTREELGGLYNKGAGTRNMTPLLKTTGWDVWSGEIKGASSAWLFYFNDGYGNWNPLNSNFGRAFAVRSQKRAK